MLFLDGELRIRTFTPAMTELLRLRERESKLETDLGGRVRATRERVEATLAKSQQLEL